MTNVHRLRLAFENRYAILTRDAPLTPSMWPFLSLPIRERLVLLCIADTGADEAKIKHALPWAKQTDVRLTSPAMVKAAATFLKVLNIPTAWIDPEGDVEKQLMQIFYPSATPMLFGYIVPPELSTLSLKTRVAIYCLVVEGLQRREVQELLECSEWYVKQAINQGLVAVSYEAGKIEQTYWPKMMKQKQW
jgi:hypothetical protein